MIPVTAYATQLGAMLSGSAEDFFVSEIAQEYKSKVDLILTSPPFPLNTKKRYGNKNGEEYLQWLAAFAPLFEKMLSPTGSIVLELGNAWTPGRPVMATLGLEALLAFLKQGRLRLCEQFICTNPARLPSPAQWVTVERIRVKDAFTHVWWMSATDHPKANNRNVLKEYSPSMRRLLQNQTYNAGGRPSQHVIGGTSFLENHGGAIPSNVLSFSNTVANDEYMQYCRSNDIPLHPARMPRGLPDFFIRLLTDAGDLVMDPFAGSNTTGAVAEYLGRRWLSIELDEQYIEGSLGRFTEGSVVAGVRARQK